MNLKFLTSSIKVYKIFSFSKILQYNNYQLHFSHVAVKSPKTVHYLNFYNITIFLSSPSFFSKLRNRYNKANEKQRLERKVESYGNR